MFVQVRFVRELPSPERVVALILDAIIPSPVTVRSPLRDALEDLEVPAPNIQYCV